MDVHTLFIRLHASSTDTAFPPGQTSATSAAQEPVINPPHPLLFQKEHFNFPGNDSH